MKIWHYTVDHHYKQIIKDGFIKTATLYVNESEKPAVWFSSNSHYEETVRKSLRDNETGELLKNLSKDALFERGVLPVRLEVNPSTVKLHNWEEFQLQSDIKKEVADSLVDVARGWGAHSEEWYASFEPVPIESGVIRVEWWNGQEWVSWNNKVFEE